MAAPYNHRAIEAKWRTKLGEKAGKCQRRQETEILLSGYVPVSVRKRSSCRTLERLCDL